MGWWPPSGTTPSARNDWSVSLGVAIQIAKIAKIAKIANITWTMASEMPALSVTALILSSAGESVSSLGTRRHAT